MEKLEARPDYIRNLQLAELLIRRKLALPDATPFLAHCTFENGQGEKFYRSFCRFLDGHASRIGEAIRLWPLISVWNIATILSRDYGDGGHAVWPVLDEAFKVSISQHDRQVIRTRFRSVCRKYGLCYEGSERYVNDFLTQAGIADSQLHHVARAFVLAERSFGPAPVDNTAALNTWEDDAAAFLPPGVIIPRTVLEVDETAHYGTLFTRHRTREPARNDFERRFFDQIELADQAVRSGQHRAEAVPLPTLLWTDNGLALSLPKLEGRLTLSVGGETKRLRGGQSWLLPMPWPSYVDWEFQGRAERVPVFPAQDSILVFDAETNRLVKSIAPTQDKSSVVDAREVMLVALRSFSADGEPAYPLGAQGHALHCQLGPAATPIETTAGRIEIAPKPKPRIWIADGAIARGPRGVMLSASAALGIEFGELERDLCELFVSIGNQHEVYPIPADRTRAYAIFDLPFDDVASTELLPVRVELRLRGSERALVRQKSWLWPGLAELSDGLVFDSPTIPANWSAERSRYIVADRSGRLSLDADAAFDKALLAFFVGNERIEFELPRPGIAMLLTSADGAVSPIKVGDTLVLRDEDKSGSLSIRCPEKLAKLEVRGRLEEQPFARSATRVLSLADLMSPAPRDEIVLHREQPGGVPLTLAKVVPALSPSVCDFRRIGASITISLELPARIDAVRFETEDELGDRCAFECQLMHRPVAEYCPPWIVATLDYSNYQRVEITFNQSKLSGEPLLARLLVRSDGEESFKPLRSPRGDDYAILVRPAASNIENADQMEGRELRSRYAALNSWMMRCFAKECWDVTGDHMIRRWMALGQELAKRTGGNIALLESAYLPPQPGSNKSWVPLAHPLQINPGLYGVTFSAFLTLGSLTGDGADHLAMLAEAAGSSIPQLHCDVGLSPAFFPAFENFQRAERTGEKLRGFDFAKYSQFFSIYDTDPGARWFWQPGDTLLGPAHYGAAIGCLIDRFFDAGLEQDGFNDMRFRQAASLAGAASRAKEKTLPVPQGIEISHALIEMAPAFLSGFARHSRQGTTESYLQAMSAQLERPYRSLVGDAAFLIRLAPELLAFYLLLWELAEEGRS
jgi:hypothetical protein